MRYQFQKKLKSLQIQLKYWKFYAYMKIVSIVLLILALTLAGCSGNKPDKEYLKGDWTDFTPKKGVHHYAGEKIEITFMRDSIFYYHAEKWSDIKHSKDTCGTLDDNSYAAGKFKVTGNKIYLKGEWTDSYFRAVVNEPCIDTGRFEWVYSIKALDDDKAELKLTSPLPYKYDWRMRQKAIITKIKKPE